MTDFFLTLLLMGAFSSGGQLPFWMTSNQFGLIPESSGAFALARMGTGYDPSKTFQWRWGASMAANYSNQPDGKMAVIPDELYSSIKWKALSLDLGLKRFDLDYYGAGTPTMGSMSTTGGHIIWSGNARTIPGYSANLAPIPVPFTKGYVKFFGSFADYKTLDNRYMNGALIHRTMMGLDIKITERLDFHGVFDHYALWGGKSEKASMPVTLGNTSLTMTVPEWDSRIFRMGSTPFGSVSTTRTAG